MSYWVRLRAAARLAHPALPYVTMASRADATPGQVGEASLITGCRPARSGSTMWMESPRRAAAAAAAYSFQLRKVWGRTTRMKMTMAGAARNAIRWLPTLRARMKAMRTRMLSSFPLPMFSCQRTASQDSSAMVRSDTV